MDDESIFRERRYCMKKSLDLSNQTIKSNIEKLKKELLKLDKSSEVVVYCGCCPFKN